MLFSWRHCAILFSGISTCLGLSCFAIAFTYSPSVAVAVTPTLPLPHVALLHAPTADPDADLQITSPVPTVVGEEPTPHSTVTPPQMVAPITPTLDFNFIADSQLPSIHIPTLGLMANIVSLPFNAGTWDVTGLHTRVGQLQLPTSRTQYAPILVAHTSLDQGQPGPFYQLADLPLGSEISVSTSDGADSYVLQRVEVLTSTQFHSLLIPDPNQLVLVTCTGWDATTQSFQNRLVIHAVRTVTAN